MFRGKPLAKSSTSVSQYLSEFLETGNFMVPISLLMLSVSNALISDNVILAKIFGSISLFTIPLYLIIYVYVKIKAKYHCFKDRFHNDCR